jgi:hypothetical protein
MCHPGANRVRIDYTELNRSYASLCRRQTWPYEIVAPLGAGWGDGKTIIPALNLLSRFSRVPAAGGIKVVNWASRPCQRKFSKRNKSESRWLKRLNRA